MLALQSFSKRGNKFVCCFAFLAALSSKIPQIRDLGEFLEMLL